METFWPWIASAGLGALHGLDPTTGWPLAAIRGVRARDRSQAWRALTPIAIGHLASVTLVAVVVAFGLSLDRVLLTSVGGGLVVLAVVVRPCGRLPRWMRAPIGGFGLSCWSFVMATVHGAGVVLVPALIPLCASGAHAGPASGALLPALAAVAIHLAALLFVSGTLATAACYAAHRLRGT